MLFSSVMSANQRRTTLLACGIAAAVLYIAMTMTVGRLWDGYSVASQTISELSAIGAPTRPLWLGLAAVYTALFAAFGWIVWTVAPPNRALRAVGAFVLAQAVFGVFWPPMHQRTVLAAGGGTLTDTLHIVWTIVTGVLFMLAMGFGAAAFGRRFRIYSVVTMGVVFACGAWTGTFASRMQANLPTPGVGVWERINTTAFMVWIAVLAIVVFRKSRSLDVRGFKSADGEAAYLAAYAAAMRFWPVRYEERDIPTSFGNTHVIVSGPSGAPAIVLLHGYMATSAMWAPNIADFSRDYRVYAIDVMGQPSKSIPDRPIGSGADYVAWLTETLNALGLDRVALVGMSYGGWLALGYAAAAPERVEKLVLLSAGGLLPMAKQFTLRGMLMVFWTTRVTVKSFMRWLGIDDKPIVELMYLGLKHFRMPTQTVRVLPTVHSDEELRSLRMPTLVLFGDREVICDPGAALARARRLIPDCQGELVAGARHEMSASRYGVVDARVLDFLRYGRRFFADVGFEAFTLSAMMSACSRMRLRSTSTASPNVL